MPPVCALCRERLIEGGQNVFSVSELAVRIVVYVETDKHEPAPICAECERNLVGMVSPALDGARLVSGTYEQAHR